MAARLVTLLLPYSTIVTVLLGAVTLYATVIRKQRNAARRAHAHSLSRLESAAIDPLTTLRNYWAYIEEAQTAFDRGDIAGLLYIDLDGLKTVNDTAGHPQGDTMLRALGERLQRLGLAATTYRIGGDELVCLLDHTITPAQIQALINALCAPLTVGAITLTVSVGYANRTPLDDLATLSRRGEDAMYDCKAQTKATRTPAIGTARVPESALVPLPVPA